MNGYDAGTATGRLDLDVSGLNQGVSDAKQSLDSLDQTANKTTADVDKYAQSLREILAGGYRDLAKSSDQVKAAEAAVAEIYATNQQKVQHYADAIVSAEVKREEATRQLASLQTALAQAESIRNAQLERYNELKTKEGVNQRTLQANYEKLQRDLQVENSIRQEMVSALDREQQATKELQQAKVAYSNAVNTASRSNLAAEQMLARVEEQTATQIVQNASKQLQYIEKNTQAYKDEQSEKEKLAKTEQQMAQSSKELSDSQMLAFSIINKAVNDTINAVKQLTQEMINLGKEILEVGANFEQSMAQVAATSGMSASDISNSISEYNDLVEAARAAGESSIFTAAQAGEALNYLALAGYTVEESIKTMPDILTIATAGAMDLGRASDMVTDSMNALGISVEDTGEFIDKMARTAQTSNTNVEQLGRAILTVGGTATVLKGGITELDTALGLMANSGIKAQQGGTSLRQILLNLTDPSEKAKKKIEELGLEVFDADGGMRSLKDIFSDLNDIMADFSDQERMNALGEIFNARHIRAAVALMQQSGDAWDELQAKIEDADGAAEKMADTMKSTLKGSVALAQSSLESVTLTINEGLRESITELVKDSIPKIDALNKVLAAPEVQSRLKSLSEQFAKLGSTILDVIIKHVPDIIEFVSHLTANLQSLAVVLTTLTGLKIALSITDIVASLSKLMTFVTANPFTLIAAGVAVLVTEYIQLKAVSDEYHKGLVAQFKVEMDTFEQQRNELHALVDNWGNAKTAYDEASKSADGQIAKIQGLYERHKELSAGLDGSTVALEELAKEIPEVNELLQSGKTDFEDITKAVDEYTGSLKRAARANAISDMYGEAVRTATEIELNFSKVNDAYTESEQNYKNLVKRHNELSKARLETVTSEEEIRRMLAPYNIAAEELENYILTFKSEGAEAFADLVYVDQDRLDAAYEIYQENKQIFDDTTEAYHDACDTVEALEGEMTQITRDNAHAREGVVADEIEGRRQAGETYAKTVGEASKKAAKATLDDFWTEYNNLSRDVDLGYKSESEKWDLVRLYFTEHPNWAMLDEEFVKLIKQLRSYDDKIAEEEKNEAEKRAKAQQDAADKAKKAREDADKKWQSSVKDAWTDTKWNASYLDYTDKQIADMGRKFLDEQKKFYDSHTDQKDDFIKEIAALDKKWVEDEKTTIDEIEKELPRLKEFYGEDSVIYKSILNIVDQKKLTDNKKTAEKWFKSWTDGYEDLVKEAQDAYKELEKKQENFGKKFLDESDLLTKKTKKTWDMVSSSWKEETVEVFDPKKYDDTYKQIQELKKITEQLRAKNLDEDTIAQLWDMDPEKALETAKQMNKYSASALADYSKKKEEVQKEIAAEAQKFYEQEAQDFQTKYMDPLQKYVTEGATKIKENMDLIGKDTVQGYIDGMVDKYDATKGAAEKIGADSIEALKKELGIASPSKEFYEIGEWSIQGFLDGLKSKVGEVATMFVTMGQTAGDHFINAFKSTWDNFVTLLNSTGGLQVPVAMTTTAFGMPVSQGAQVTYTGTGTSVYGLTKDDVVSAIKEAVPDGDVILKVGESEFAKISRSSLNNLALQEGSMGLSV